MRAVKNIALKVGEQIDQYINSLKELQRSLVDTSSVGSHVLIHRVAADMLEQAETLKNIGAHDITHDLEAPLFD